MLRAPLLLSFCLLERSVALLVVSSSLRPRHSARPGEALRWGVILMADEGFTFGDAEEVSGETNVALQTEERELTEKEKEIARLRAAEKFMKKDTGNALCKTCNYKYDMEVGDRMLPRNTPFELIPDSWVCPNCASPKAFFEPEQIEIAGFADNQAYGLGTNTWTESQKSTAIFGGLALFFLLFLSGYALN